ncbi:AAA family ATPase [Pseudoclavibacter caeni]|uniref:MoxR family ATPase n=1 Tax=Pseudoclavibacter caeni TaxID=908846 RepID=A0A7C8BP47_9MICO|nr:MoxR family ATPase [Pseudoclavibacter caeni]KAB1633531.1 MoxR family ATPase [Pseudoclavibacter caeni]NYJ96469.1 MoxR-like ATPase [Pseudoclavibacter caeni]
MSSSITAEQSAWFGETFGRLVSNVEQAIVGKRHVIELAFATLLTRGHLLLEDVPGTGKTALARAISRTVRGTSSRIQFTPDLLPGDITGISIYDQKRGEFSFHEGPVFANIVLADEINRASPKTQSALLEVMEEQQVTVDGVTHRMPSPFMVIATQNPVEQAGTYRLPEAQLDRFLVKMSLGYPDAASTRRILEGQAVGTEAIAELILPQAVGEMIALARLVTIEPAIVDYITRLVEATRDAAQTRLGASVRGAIALANISRTWAIAHGRPYVIPDDVKAMAVPVLAHRLILDPEAEFDGVTPESVIGQILLDTAPPTQGAVA